MVPSKSESIRNSQVLPLRDEPKIQTRRSSRSSRVKSLFVDNLSMVSALLEEALADGTRRPGSKPGRTGIRGLRGVDSRLPLLGVNALRELLHALRAEGIVVFRLAARHEPRVDVHFLVDPFAAGVADVRLQAWPRGDGPAL